MSMEVPCFMDGWGILVELSKKSACFMDGGSVLVCLSMKVPCFVDGWGFEEGCPQNRVVFEGDVPVRGVFWARVEVLMRRAWRWRGKKYESWLLGRDSMWDCLLCGWRLWGFQGTLVWVLLIGGDQKSFFLLTVATNSLR